MLKHRRSGIALFLLLSAISALIIGVQPVKAATTIYIMPDGSVVPPETPIQRNGNMYTFLNNIAASIVVLKSNIVIDGTGHTLQGTGIENGIELSSLTNVTVKNMTITAFDYGIYIAYSSQISVTGNSLLDNSGGIWLKEATDNIVKKNLIKLNSFDGIYLWSSLNNTLSENTVENNTYGISPYYGSDNKIYHNNFVNNEYSVNPNDPTDLWDDSYPSGGNYWSDYTGIDLKRGAGQNEAGSDGVGDTAYVLDTTNHDRFPLMKPYAGPHDIGITWFSMSKTIVGQGYSLPASVKIVNYGEQLESFNLAIKANSTTIQTMPVTLTGRNSTTVSLLCPTSGLAKGSYSVSAYATPVPSETDTSDNTRSGGLVFVSIAGDVNADKKVDLKDVFAVGKAYGSRLGDPRYDPNLDINNDGIIDLKDYFIVCKNYGQSW
jgi:parallel beta-helix repeat protein